MSVATHLEKQYRIIRRLACGTSSPATMPVDKVGVRALIDDQVDLGKKLGFYLSIGYCKIREGWILGYFNNSKIAIID